MSEVRVVWQGDRYRVVSKTPNDNWLESRWTHANIPGEWHSAGWLPRELVEALMRDQAARDASPPPAPELGAYR